MMPSVRRTEIKTHLLKKGYANDMLEKQLKKVDTLDRENKIREKIREISTKKSTG